MLILKLLVFAIPVAFAAILHMIAIKVNFLSFLKIPLDFGRKYNGKRIFGNHKTIRGVILMMAFSVVGMLLLKYLVETYTSVSQLNIIDFNRYSVLFYGVLFGLGYTLAELPNSFYKRRANIEEGKRGNVLNILIDQFDSPFGCLLTLAPFTNMSLTFFVVGAFFYLFLHLFFNFALYILHLRTNPL
jgi:hypothetical protein